MEHVFGIFLYCLPTPTLVENKSNWLLSKRKKYGKEKKERRFLVPAFTCAHIYVKRQFLIYINSYNTEPSKIQDTIKAKMSQFLEKLQGNLSNAQLCLQNILNFDKFYGKNIETYQRVPQKT